MRLALNASLDFVEELLLLLLLRPKRGIQDLLDYRTVKAVRRWLEVKWVASIAPGEKRSAASLTR